jgi:hypothetical protein
VLLVAIVALRLAPADFGKSRLGICSTSALVESTLHSPFSGALGGGAFLPLGMKSPKVGGGGGRQCILTLGLGGPRSNFPLGGGGGLHCILTLGLELLTGVAVDGPRPDFPAGLEGCLRLSSGDFRGEAVGAEGLPLPVGCEPTFFVVG